MSSMTVTTAKSLIPAKGTLHDSDAEDDRDTSSEDDEHTGQSEDDSDVEMDAEDELEEDEDTDGIAGLMKKMEGSLKKTIITTVKGLGGLKPMKGKGKVASSKKAQTRRFPRRNHKQQEKDALEEEKAGDEAWQRRAFLVSHR